MRKPATNLGENITYSVITFSPTPVSLTAFKMPMGIRKNSDMPTDNSSPHTGNCSGAVSYTHLTLPTNREV